MKKILCLVIILVFEVVFFPAPCVSQEDEDYTISIDFQHVPLGSVLRVLSSKTGRKLITGTNLAGKKIVLQLKDVTPDEAVNALLDTYDLYYIRQADTNIYVIRSKTVGKIKTVSKIFYCSHARAGDLAGVLSSKLTPGGNMQADKRTNCLIVTDMADNIDKIAEMIKELDSPTPQVMLETKIIDIKMDDDFKFGIQIDNLYNTEEYWEDPLVKRREGSVSGTDIMPKYEYTQPLGQGVGFGGIFSMAIIHKGFNIEGFIDAAMVNTDAEVISNPRLMVLNNQVAKITIADEIPYQLMTRTEDEWIISTEFKQVGVLLTVRPLINKNRTIILEITPEQSFLTGYTPENIPIINTSKVETTFMIRDGETAIIGGLIREEQSVSEAKVPILGDIPIVGYLFKKVTKDKTRKELTIFVTANIIDLQEE